MRDFWTATFPSCSRRRLRRHFLKVAELRSPAVVRLRRRASPRRQKTRNPWEDIGERYPIGSIHDGEIVNIMNYGAFVRLEAGIEGLVHISEISWTKQATHPGELVKPNEKVKLIFDTWRETFIVSACHI